MNTPDITPAAIVSLVMTVLTNLIVLFQLDITDAQKGAIEGLVNAAAIVAFFVHDAWLRGARNKRAGAEALANVQQGIPAALLDSPPDSDSQSRLAR